MKNSITIDCMGYISISMIGLFTKRENLQEWNDFKSLICNYLHTVQFLFISICRISNLLIMLYSISILVFTLIMILNIDRYEYRTK